MSKRGKLHKIRPGFYMRDDPWSALSSTAQHRLRATATATYLSENRLISHRSAATLHDLPLFGHMPDKIDVTALRKGGGMSSPHIRFHTVAELPLAFEVNGVRLTSPERTVVDLARLHEDESALMAADVLVRDPAGADRLRRALAHARGMRGASHAARLLPLADPRSESPGESLTRLRLIQLGVTGLDLQYVITDANGFVGRTDFAIPELKLVIEFDGMVKYRLPEGASTAEISQVLVQEKRREDRIRRLGYRVVRLTWADVIDPSRLAQILAPFGVRMSA